jgi:hypothetical protein
VQASGWLRSNFRSDLQASDTSQGIDPGYMWRSVFATVMNPESTAVIDTLLITLTNAAAACCNNPMGLDNIVISRYWIKNEDPR